MKPRHILAIALFSFFLGSLLATQYAHQQAREPITCTSAEMTRPEFQHVLDITQQACLTQIAECESKCSPTQTASAH